MTSPVDRIRRNIDASISAQQQLLADTHTLAGFARAVDTVVCRYRKGGRLYISSKAVDHHVSALLSKLQVTSRRDAVRRGTELGLLGEREDGQS